MSLPNTPLFVKTHDFVLWLIRHTQRFPKNLRHTLTHKLEWTVIDLQQTLIMANTVRGPARLRFLEQADGQLVCVRVLLTLAGDLALLGATQVRYSAECLEELGRLLGAWKKGTDR